jgi:hypothetical protein
VNQAPARSFRPLLTLRPADSSTLLTLRLC